MAHKNLQRKLVQIAYDTKLVKGSTVSIRSGDDVELLISDNDGLVQVTYPMSFSGAAELVVVGSKSGEDAASFSVS